MLEIACFNHQSAIAAANAGADRIELCADYAAGGVTPSLSALQHVRNGTTIPVNVMIRPRGGDFNYNAEEFTQMKEEMSMLKSLASGFVFGILDLNNLIDNARNRELVQLAAPLACTFHRAIDETKNLEKSVETVIDCGFKSLLTSGGMRNALEGAERLKKVQEKYGKTLSIIAGGGVRCTNIEELNGKTGVAWLHSAAITQHGEDVDELEVKRMQTLLAVLERQ